MKLQRSSSSDPLNASAEAFLRDILAVCERHGLAISHEDAHGGFEIVEADDFHAGWLSEATDCRASARAIRWQRQAAYYHALYEHSRDAGICDWAATNQAEYAAQAFRTTWRLRFGTDRPEAWS